MGNFAYDFDHLTMLKARREGSSRSTARLLAIELLDGGRPALMSPDKRSEIEMIDAVIAELQLLKQIISEE